VRSVGHAELVEQLVHPGPPGAAQMVQVGHQPHVLHAREQLVQRGELPGDPDRGPHLVRVVHHVVAGHAQPSCVWRNQGGEDPNHRGLAGAVRSEEGEDRSLGDRQVDAVEHDLLTKGLSHAGNDDRRWAGTGHRGPP